MEESAIVMKAYAVNFNEMRVYLSKNYYNGMSSKFYLKDLKNDELTLLEGDALDSHDSSFQEYSLRTTFQVGKVYKVVDAYGMSCFLDFSKLSMCKEFDDLYYYDGDDLGCTYTKERSLFKVWAPLSTGVILKVHRVKDGKEELYPMTRGLKGVYYCEVKGDLENDHYFYLIKHAGQYDIVMDPYAYSSSSNGRTNIIVDLDKLKVKDYPLPPMDKKTDAIIYETNVRDFSISETGSMKHKGQFLAFTEENTTTKKGYSTGLDYLAELGITHVQLMPINDYATVDEKNPSVLYNWGYDPSQYNVTEGSYVTNPDDGYKRILEAKQMIASLHKKGIRVVLDVVYNHMHNINNNALEKTVPYYFFRRYDNGVLGNGSWCGNELNTNAKMCRKYILDMCKRWQVLYGVDGYRFDLMGLVDIDTIRLVNEQAKAIDPSFMVYGEGWNMGDILPNYMKATMDNHAMLQDIGFFNDTFRNTMRGTNQMESLGYLSGDTYKTFEGMKMMCNIEKFTNISQSINYVECHDNATCYDKIQISNYDEDDETKKRRLRMMLAGVILAQGIPFIHSGQEFFRTKHGRTNTYNSGDFINALDWELREKENDTIEFVKFLIQLRKNNPCFRYDDYEIMKENITLENIEHRMVKYHLHQNDGEYQDIIVYLNASLDDLSVNVEDDYKVLYHSDDEDISHGYLKIQGTATVILGRRCSL